MNNSNILTKEEEQLDRILLSFKHKMTNSFFEEAKKLELPPSNFEILIYLYEKGPITMKNIASWLSITPPSASSLIDKLVSKELVNRVQSDNDRRTIHISLGKEAHKLFAKLHRKKVKLFEEMLDKLDKKDKENLVRILNKCIS